jgi:saccharopine dehydrogenase-like NADP-dependent oxidoreductase
MKEDGMKIVKNVEKAIKIVVYLPAQTLTMFLGGKWEQDKEVIKIEELDGNNGAQIFFEKGSVVFSGIPYFIEYSRTAV